MFTHLMSSRLPHAVLLALGALTLGACTESDAPDAYGNFEAEEVVVAAETPGQIERLDALEGRLLAAGEVVGLIDTTQLTLEREQLAAQRRALTSQRREVERQADALDVQREIADRVWERTQRLFAGGAATAAQRDAAERDVRVLTTQAAGARVGLERLGSELSGLDARLAAVEDRLGRTRITNPVRGTVLALYARTGEMIQTGQALYRVADLDTLTLRAYITGGQLAAVKLGDRVTVQIDSADGALASREGTVTWISARAEFTPTPVQTRDERADLVYAVKIRVANADGALKVGMPADVTFATTTAAQTP
jgi:HlyD family secretion protein